MTTTDPGPETSNERRHGRPLAYTGVALLMMVACSSTGSSSSPTGDGGTADGSTDGGIGSMDGVATCASPGVVTAGPAPTQCQGTGGTIVTATSAASCHVTAAADDAGASDAAADAGADHGEEACEYGPTMYGSESDDDDCKYHVKWTAGALCEGTAGVPFTVVVTRTDDGAPVTGAAARAELFATTAGDASCDNGTVHPSPVPFLALVEGPAGTYTGNLQFDQPGAWTVRFHFFEQCTDVAEDSPHGHAAYHLTLP